ncbi:DUF2332 domain-containing protein [Egicoccus sp. AB-alg6-2]|uniref:DUF2332 domain-containing protein n=1 Tax=Egicoccus sp. AB-alg6-2 TaxID=3242692 RepID=UPI00359E0F94
MRSDGRSPRELAEKFGRFAPACEQRSPLYGHLARAAAHDLDVAGLLAAAPTSGLAHPTLLFAAVHDLVLRGEAPELAAWYPTAGGTRSLTDGDPWPVFRAAVLQRRAAVEECIRTRRTQTNEVGRSTALLAALRLVERDAGRPLAWLDVGTSAGLTMRLRHFRHDLVGDGVVSASLGPADATVRLRCDVEGQPPFDALPEFAWRAGLDAAPVEAADADAAGWLQACVWPEQTDRLDRLRAALQVAARDPVPIHAGDAVGDLAGVAAQAPSDAHLVISHTWVLAYLERDAREAFDDAVASIGADRDLDRIGMESGGIVPGTRPDEVARSWLGRTTWRDGDRHDAVVAEVDDHGRWLRWGVGPR